MHNDIVKRLAAEDSAIRLHFGQLIAAFRYQTVIGDPSSIPPPLDRRETCGYE